MPQWRKLHTKSVESLDIHDMPDDFHRLLWLMLPLVLDRCGRGVDSAAWVRSKAMPMRDDISNEMAGAALDWYAEHRMIERYEVEGRRYFWIPTWHNHQGDTGREADSLYPAPGGYFDPYAREDEEEETPNDYGNGQEQSGSESGASQDLVTSKSGLDSDANADTTSDSEEDPPPAAKPPPPPPRRKRKQPTAEQQASRVMFAALADSCQIDLALLTDAQRGQLNQTEKRLRKRGINPLDLEAFTAWWYENDWRGKKKSPPKPAQVREEWGKFTASKEKHGTVEIASGLGERA